MGPGQFQSGLKNKVALVDFNAPWCAPGKSQEPFINDLAREYQGRVSIVKINIDQESVLATHYMVQSIPTLILFNNGQEVKRLIGCQTRESIEMILADLVGNQI